MLLNEEELPEIDPRDDHKVHLETHAKANQNAQTRAHMRMHEELALQVRNNPELFPQEQAQQFQPPAGTGSRTNLPVTAPPEGAMAQ